MKRFIALLIAAATIISASACTSTDDESGVKTETNSALLEYYKNDEAYFDYKTNHYKFRIPTYWKGKFTTVVSEHREDFYLQSAYDTDETGLAFSILEYEDKRYKRELKNYTYLCYDKRFELHYILVEPEEEICPEEYKEEYEKLRKIVPIVKNTFKAEM
ncbi:MAG: hypothetical protein SOZ34_10820 [Clostridia bacterium]|nr:hypothetical protein [Clostridia bacterium]